MSLSAVPDAEQRLPSVTALATAGGLRAMSGGSLSTHSERDLSLFGGRVTFTLGTADESPRRSGSFLRLSMTKRPFLRSALGSAVLSTVRVHNL